MNTTPVIEPILVDGAEAVLSGLKNNLWRFFAVPEGVFYLAPFGSNLIKRGISFWKKSFLTLIGDSGGLLSA
jgi:hypothetical protein